MNVQHNITLNPESIHKESAISKILFNLTGICSVLYITINTLIGYPFLLTAAMLKLILPFDLSRKFFTKILIFIATTWIKNNNFLFSKILRIKIHVTGEKDLPAKEWYMVISNHQSWSDIVVLQMVLNGKIPLLKFFLKQELIRVPLLGIAWWALDFPFMKRFSSEFLKQHPSMKGKDIEITRKACKKFKYTPVSIMSFVEGTRFTDLKHKQQSSPYKNLLKPRAGGTGFVFSAMGEQLHCILDVTIKYPERDLDFWNFLCGRVHRVSMHIEKLPMRKELIGDYDSDMNYQKFFCGWLNDLWGKKDKFIDLME